MIDQQRELIAVMANTVSEAYHALTVPEQRLVLWMMTQITGEDDALRKYSMGVNEFAEILGSNNGRLYEQMEAVCQRLHTRTLKVRTGRRGYILFYWMHYMYLESRIALQFHEDLKPVLLQLRERLCQVPIKDVTRLQQVAPPSAVATGQALPSGASVEPTPFHGRR
ncbi:MAG: repB [Verrucomicrobiales bacterium]|nr:repB [Verrucomicrobiales bacterium]